MKHRQQELRIQSEEGKEYVLSGIGREFMVEREDWVWVIEKPEILDKAFGLILWPLRNHRSYWFRVLKSRNLASSYCCGLKKYQWCFWMNKCTIQVVHRSWTSCSLSFARSRILWSWESLAVSIWALGKHTVMAACFPEVWMWVQMRGLWSGRSCHCPC